ncbi:hypothetical protein [Clostridium estertheticum]|uniref:hypothetical protein n=1 Tax=Clostridium estertheticum TaxID=238834 RepID=UPI001C0B43DA|nr:hypothetical protein [Clostridium estertheticum]MBU3072846.1 hypothetical protein [Clostridium estertheticum]MBU3163117.1 hypothetical protein [Clostridium estertheticum]
MDSNLHKQDKLIQMITCDCDRSDILSISRSIGIRPSDFDSPNLPMRQLAEDFVTRAFQKGKSEELLKEVNLRKIGLVSKNSVGDKSVEIFMKLLNHFLNKFDDIEEKEFDESELFDPIEFEEKMRVRANLSEDIVRAGVRIKSDITVLRRKAYALDYKKYKTLIQKLAKYYMYTICIKYPLNEFDSNTRFGHLYNELLAMIPDELYENDSNIEEKIEGIIFDTISKCLIFNE